MKRRIAWCAAAWLGAFAPARAEPVAAASAGSLDLTQCFELAKRQSETLRISEEQINQIEQQYRQVLGSALPNVAFNASQGWQAPDPLVGGTFSATSRPQANFTLNQPLFSGLREYAAMRGFEHQGKAAELQLGFAGRQLFLNVSNAFYLVLSLEKSLEDTEALRSMTEDRVKELQDRERLGKSRVSEVLAVESQSAVVEAQIEALKGQIAAARELLSFLIGQDASGAALQDKLPDAPPFGSQEEALERAKGRSDVKAAQETQAAQREQLRIAWGAWYPQAGFTGNYYLKRIALLEPIRWDATFNLSFPIFSGGAQLAQVRLARSLWRAAQDASSLTYRQARSQIRTDYLALQASLAQFRILREAYEKARGSYRLEAQEYRLGIVDNLTVLQAMNAMQSAKLSLDQTAFQIKTGYLQLKVATEELP